MKLVSLRLEQKLLVCLLETTNQKIRTKILREAPVELFGTEPGFEVRQRISDLLEMGKPLGRCVDFSEDPALTDEASNFIRGSAKNRKKVREYNESYVESVINNLQQHKVARICQDGMHRISKIANAKLGRPEQQEIKKYLEQWLLGMVEDQSKRSVIHYGSRAEVSELKDMVKRLTTFEKEEFVSTGIRALDDHLKGWERNTLVTYSAIPGDGKTTLALDAAVNQYLDTGHNVCFVSMEMPHTRLEKRMMSKLTRIPHSVIRYSDNMKDEQKDMIDEAVKRFFKHGKKHRCNFTIRDVAQGSYTPQILETELAPGMYDVIIIDYLTLFDSKGMDSWKAVMEYSRYLKLLSQRMNSVIVSLTQLTDKGDPKYGRAIKDNTDYWLKWFQDRDDEGNGTGEVTFDLAKARHERSIRFPGKLNFDYMTVETSGPEMIGTSAVRRRKKEEEERYEEQIGSW